MDSVESWFSILKSFWYIEAGIIGIAIFIYRGMQNSKDNRADIDRHDKEIDEIHKSLNHLNESYSKQETQIDQLLEISRETRDEVRELLKRLIKP